MMGCSPRCASCRYTGRMLTLTPNECRVLGVLVEKAQTTPQQYPLTLNALTSGCNQKNNREPVTNLTDEQVLQAIDSLRAKGLAREVMLSGSRVEKFRHIARETLQVDTNQLVILTELLLRGPQTIGELRGRASRMHPLETTEIVKNILDSLMQRPEGREPMIRQLPPAPGTGDRASRYAQLLCPNLHPLDAAPAPAVAHHDTATSASISSNSSRAVTAAPQHASTPGDEVAQRISALEKEVADLRAAIERISVALGESVAR